MTLPSSAGSIQSNPGVATPIWNALLPSRLRSPSHLLSRFSDFFLHPLPSFPAPSFPLHPFPFLPAHSPSSFHPARLHSSSFLPTLTPSLVSSYLNSLLTLTTISTPPLTSSAAPLNQLSSIQMFPLQAHLSQSINQPQLINYTKLSRLLIKCEVLRSTPQLHFPDTLRSCLSLLRFLHSSVSYSLFLSSQFPYRARLL